MPEYFYEKHIEAGVPERSKGLAWRASAPNGARGFESRPRRFGFILSSPILSLVKKNLKHEEDKYFGRWIKAVSATVCELRDTSPEGNYVLTLLLITANVIISLLSFWTVWNYKVAVNTLPFPMSVLAVPATISAIIYAMFVHGDPLHLIGNMIFLFIVGDDIEITLGKVRFLLIYFLSGI